MTREDYEFPNCMHALSAAMHLHNIDPAQMEICLPFEEWWKLHCALESKFRGLLTFDGRGEAPQSFKYMGFTFAAKATS